ncbi:MAG: protein-methionine-sulfoxide reductase catalytic subunit MsrP [Anaerolineae bacterium]|nr:protein-methionine-sulfoxide reductase catalytic subunit MsrP [Anaerolineae bacterium]
MKKIVSSEITPEHIYLSRRRFLKGAAGLALSSAVLAACGKQPAAVPATVTPQQNGLVTPASGVTPLPTPQPAQGGTDLDLVLTSYEAVTGYNNFYEFSYSKEQVAELAKDYVTSPWSIQVGGLVNKPQTFDLDDLRNFEQEERIYRMRCVEAWSMVIPWFGFPLAKLLAAVDPTSEAKYVLFETDLNKEAMPGITGSLPYPYTEGLRLDEAMHNLTLMATGLYGKDLLPQNGAPVRLVVPWKYGFKSLKSIVRIELVSYKPATFWTTSGPTEYGFWANVNPEVGHPRWSQATERRIGENKRVETLFFNGYADEVAHLYPNLDSRDWYF